VFLEIFLVLLTVIATSAAFWQFAARNRPLFAIFSLEGPAIIDQTVYSRMKIVLRNWGGTPAENTEITLDVSAFSHNKPRKTMSWTGRINGPVYPGQEFSILPDLDFRGLVKSGYTFTLTSNIRCSSTVPIALRQMKIVRLLSHSQKQVWEWNENTWKLVGSDLNNLQAAAE
jgi:hypothetical protein